MNNIIMSMRAYYYYYASPLHFWQWQQTSIPGYYILYNAHCSSWTTGTVQRSWPAGHQWVRIVRSTIYPAVTKATCQWQL